MIRILPKRRKATVEEILASQKKIKNSRSKEVTVRDAGRKTNNLRTIVLDKKL